jgi:hypothetical protein
LIRQFLHRIREVSHQQIRRSGDFLISRRNSGLLPYSYLESGGVGSGVCKILSGSTGVRSRNPDGMPGIPALYTEICVPAFRILIRDA